MSIFKIALYGDSLACPRQGIVNSDERYIALIDKFLRKKNFDYIEIRDRATGGATITQLYSNYYTDNTYYTLPGDVLIIHAGIVDCAPRPISDKLRNRISKLPEFIKKRIIAYIHKNRRSLILKGKKYVKTDEAKFKMMLNAFLSHAKDNYKKIFVINISPTNSDIEKHSPGFSESISHYNNLINELIKLIGSNKIMLVDIYNEIASKPSQIDDYVVKEDGHHIHVITHEIISRKIIEELEKEFLPH